MVPGLSCWLADHAGGEGSEEQRAAASHVRGRSQLTVYELQKIQKYLDKIYKILEFMHLAHKSVEVGHILVHPN